MDSTSMTTQPNNTGESRLRALSTPIVILLAVLAVMWVVEIADLAFHNLSFDDFGIRPRTREGLWRIPVAPFLHAGFSHLIANSIPILILGWMIIIRDRAHFALVFVVAALVSGLGIWVFGGANTVHIGASGVVFGFLGYLLGRGYFERSFVSILFGIVALFLYGGILIGVLPGQPGVSWLGHLFGLAGGVLAAYLITRSPSKTKSSETALQQSAG